MKIVVVGSINIDNTFKVDELPRLGETLITSCYNSSYGGKGANQAVAAARLGADVSMVGCVGNDIIGDKVIKNLQNEKINVDSIIKVNDAVSGNAFITIDNKGDNTIIVYSGANEKLNCDIIESNEDAIKNADLMMTQLEIPIESIEKAMKIAKENNVKVLLNPAPVKNLPDSIYKLIDVITPNETELIKLTGMTNVKDGAKMLLEKGVKSVIVTLGDKGSYYLDCNGEIFNKSFHVDAKDTTAAGDSFNAAIAIKLISGEEIDKGLLYANAVGALTTTKLGAQESLPYKQEVEEFMK